MIAKYFIYPLIGMISNCFLLWLLVTIAINTKKYRSLRKKSKSNWLSQVTGYYLVFSSMNVSYIIKGMVILLIVGLTILVVVLGSGITYLLFNNITILKCLNKVVRFFSFITLIVCLFFSILNLSKRKT